MRPADLNAIETFLDRLPDGTINPRSCVILSGDRTEAGLINGRWPHLTAIDTFSIEAWDLNGTRPPPHGADLVMACNTFLCSEEPMDWMVKCANNFRWLLIQDCAVARRHSYRHLAPETGDHTRFEAPLWGLQGETDDGHPIFNLDTCGFPILDLLRYEDDGGRTVKFVALLDLHYRLFNP